MPRSYTVQARVGTFRRYHQHLLLAPASQQKKGCIKKYCQHQQGRLRAGILTIGVILGESQEQGTAGNADEGDSDNEPEWHG
ncbi:hypothetical protein PR048_033150 [Dryococelus australis]|uniref:Uncharacterized protein n=1 Tax=Dryococelus australis TaxID=614101 RepID=A0ABQ9FZE8_9NEOP|nr:hypothetical protein PR048_033150 [Dryococelus australis]